MLNVQYRRAAEREAPPRKLAPLGLVLKGGVWYLVAQSGKLIRTYRAANISDASLCDGTFTRPRNFDLAMYWEKTARDYEAGLYHQYADVRLSSRGVAVLALLGPYVTASVTKTARKPDLQGWVRCRLPIENIDYGVHEMLRLGNEVDVIGPVELRAALFATARDIAQRATVRSLRRETPEDAFSRA